MNFELDEDNELLALTLREYALKELLPDMGRWRSEPYPAERIRQLGQLGVLGMLLPIEYGGSAGSHLTLGIATEKLSRGDFNISHFLQLSAISGLLMTNANDVLKKQWLPGVGSDAANLACRATRDGDSWVINGKKSSITFAGSAGACIVFARTGGPGARGISMILVPLSCGSSGA